MKILRAFIVCLSAFIFLLNSAEAATKKQTKKAIKAATKKGKLKLPSNKAAVKTKKNKNQSSANYLYTFDSALPATSGTPPTIVSLGDSSIKETFWAPGFIDEVNSAGSLTQSQCEQFFGLGTDGESGGFLSCNLAQNVAHSFEIILQGEVSMCILRAMASAQSGVSVDGAATVAEALTPNTDNTPKLVKVAFGGFPGEGGPNIPGVYISIPGAETNKLNDNLYERTIYFYEGGANPMGRENGVITKSLLYTTSQMFFYSGLIKYLSSVSSPITLNDNGTIIFDPETEKTMNTSYVGIGGGGICDYNKVEMTFNDKKIKQKLSDKCFGDPIPSYSVLRYSGSNMSNLRFIEGGAKDSFITSITEYRDSSYVSAPDNNEFLTDLAEVDLSEDFFTQEPEIDTSELNSFDCTRTDIDATITLDFTSPALQAKLFTCQTGTLSNLDFCQADADVNAAATKAFNECSF